MSLRGKTRRHSIDFPLVSGKPNDTGPRLESSAKLCLKLGLLFLSGTISFTHVNRQQILEQRCEWKKATYSSRLVWVSLWLSAQKSGNPWILISEMLPADALRLLPKSQ